MFRLFSFAIVGLMLMALLPFQGSAYAQQGSPAVPAQPAVIQPDSSQAYPAPNQAAAAPTAAPLAPCALANCQPPVGQYRVMLPLMDTGCDMSKISLYWTERNTCDLPIIERYVDKLNRYWMWVLDRSKLSGKNFTIAAVEFADDMQDVSSAAMRGDLTGARQALINHAIEYRDSGQAIPDQFGEIALVLLGGAAVFPPGLVIAAIFVTAVMVGIVLYDHYQREHWADQASLESMPEDQYLTMDQLEIDVANNDAQMENSSNYHGAGDHHFKEGTQLRVDQRKSLLEAVGDVGFPPPKCGWLESQDPEGGSTYLR